VEGLFIMLFMRFSPVSRTTWEVSAPVKSTKPIATITRRKGQCSVTMTAKHALDSAELAALSCFMQEHERAS
jgi:hypothetical protein